MLKPNANLLLQLNPATPSSCPPLRLIPTNFSGERATQTVLTCYLLAVIALAGSSYCLLANSVANMFASQSFQWLHKHTLSGLANVPRTIRFVSYWSRARPLLALYGSSHRRQPIWSKN